MFCFQPVRFPAFHPRGTVLLACLAAAAILACGAAWADEAAAPAEAAAKLNFMGDVWPILSGRCVECHGPEKQKGDLRLDSPESIQKGGSFGPVIEAGNPDGSVFIELISLPADDADVMPAKGDPLSAEEIALLRRWVEEGATFEGWDPAAPAPMPDAASADSAAHEASPDAAPPVEDILTILAKDVPQPDEAVLDAVKAHGALAMRLGQNTPLVRVNYQRAWDEFDPGLLQSLAPLAPQLTWLNLAGTGVQDEHLALLAPLTKLTSLHLERTDITDAGLVHLKDLTNLRYLNLYDTNITDAGLENLKGLTNLEKLYLWQTQVTPEAAEALKLALPDVVINLGSELQTPAAEAAVPPDAAKPQLTLLFDAEGCCATALAEGKACEHPCCIEAAAKGEVCAKCNPGAAAKQLLIGKFDEGGCCASAYAAGKACDHPCCVEAWAKGEVCAKCNPGAAPEPPSDPAEDLAASFDEGSCCFAAHAQGTACPHPCCVEALAELEVCTKCNPGAATAPAAGEAEPPAEAAEEAPPPGDAPQAEPAEPAAEPSSDQLAFNRDIRPILSHNCFLCHGPDKNMRKSGLRLDVRDEAVAPRDGVYAIFPGDISQSELVRRITSTDPDVMMPPPASQRSLKPEDIATLTAWVEQGAAYQPHWAYIAAVRPQLPQVADAQWPANAIDNFVLARLEQKGLTPSPEADRATSVRRLSFDLIGLPPTSAEVDAFLNDSSDNAYENLVDRLLASPHFGERMAVDWLDQVRYADTNGFHSDEYRSVWPYRDYVINAFNANMPFDQFTIEQLAGDLLPGATTEQKVASAYNRLNQLTAEGGAQPGEYLAKYAADRVRTTASVWMGATMGCAECHDHKFDPYTARDFYSMEAFFADIEEVGVYGGGSLWEPILRLPSPEQEQKLAQLDADLARLEQLLTTPTDETRIAQGGWETATLVDLRSTANNWTTLHPAAMEATGGIVLSVDEQGVVLAGGENPATGQYTLTFHTAQRNITGIRLSAIAHPSFNGGLSRASGNFILTTFEVEANGAPVPVASAVADFEQENWPVAGALDDNPATGWEVAGHERRGEDHAAVFRFAEPVPGGEGTVITVRMKHESAHAQHSVDCFTLAFTTMAQPDLPVVDKLSPDLRLILDKPETERSEEEAHALAKHYLSVAPEFADERAQQAALMEERTDLINALPYTLVTQAREEPRTIRILPRGNWMDESGDVVEPRPPEFLPPLEVEGRRATRLDLAHWLVSPENPLTARVQVNRFWKLFFGTGLSKTLDDLGNQGEWPTHPGLIDWLAVEFRESGWNMKHTIKLIVMSNTYRQASLPRDEVDAVDPRNRLLARQSRFRLEAELVRDNALAVSDLLSEKMGGPSVYPYQPDGYWDNCNTFRGPLIYTASEGKDQYRRGLYTIWKRSFLHPSMIAFDAPNREECVADRAVSNTPLQALVLLNDPSYIEAARVFAERILAEGGDTFESRLDFAFKHALSRVPRPEEAGHLRALCEKHVTEFSQSEEGTVAFVSTGQAPLPGNTNEAELAAWTSVARVIFNLHETITRS